MLMIIVNLLFLKAVLASYNFSNYKCRQYAGTCSNSLIPLIVGGRDAAEKEFPHMALIGFGAGANIKWNCGGALISEKFVLSAAHCADSRELGNATYVRFGIINRENLGKHMQQRKITRIFKHPNYKKPMKYDDIAIFELNRNVFIDDYVRPACLNTQPKIIGLFPEAIGFGKTKFYNDEAHESLQKVNLPILKNSVCQPFYTSMKVSTLNKGGLIESQLCAGVLEGGKDTCQGDSGGPLHIFMDAPECNYVIVGITSFGKFCGYAKSPAIYSNVYHYVPWIVKTVWGKGN